MSYTEINHNKGMPYGGMPAGAILEKLEVTDPHLVAQVRGEVRLRDPSEEVDDYMRAEIVDRTPDQPIFASDAPRSNETTSRSILNLRYNGGRGSSDYKYPRHPEMFMGFMGNDPRGADTQPRFEKLRKHTETRMVGIGVRLGENVGPGDLQDTTRPWTHADFQRGQVRVRRTLKERMRWFIASKEGRPWGANMVADEYFGGRQRRALANGGAEAADPGLGRDPSGSADPARGAKGQAPTSNVVLGDPARAAAEAKGDTDLPVQQYVGTRSRREKFGTGGTGGARAKSVASDQDPGRSAKSAAQRRVDLARSMRAALRAREVRPGQAATLSATAQLPGASNVGLGRDTRRSAAVGVRRDGAARALPSDVGGVLGPGAGLGAPSADPQAIQQSVRPSHTAPAATRLRHKAEVRRALKAVSASQTRGARNNALASGARTSAVANHTADVLPGGARRPDDMVAARHLARGAPTRTALAQGLEVQTYGGHLIHKAPQSGVAKSAHDTRLQRSARTRRQGETLAPRRRGAGKDPATLGDAARRVFRGTPLEESARVSVVTSGGGRAGSRSALRATGLSGAAAGLAPAWAS